MLPASPIAMTTIQVGSVVRAPRGVSKLKGRAVVALVQEEDETACILWEDLAPRPLQGNRPLPFIVTPMVPRSKEEREDTIGLSDTCPLLDFEQDPSASDETDVKVWKERGDELLRLGDASAAIPHYEAGLAISSVLQVGSTGLVVSQKDVIQVAEVDYLEDGNADVTIGDEERTITESEIKLCFLAGQESLQVRILLNLTRCLLQVAELEDSQMSAYYRRSAATACSMALAILDSLEDDDVESLHATALLLRSKAYASRSKWKSAMADAQSLTTSHPNYKEGRTWLPQLESQMTRQQKTNQKLAKSMCAWVQNATTAEGGDRGETLPTSSVSQVANDDEKGSSFPSTIATRTASPLTLFWYLLCPLLLVVWTHVFLTELRKQDNQSHSS